MEIEKNVNILYTPDIDYERNYDTTGKIDIKAENQQQQNKDLIEKLYENINNIENVLPLLPDNTDKMLKPIITVINKILPKDKVLEEPDRNKETIYLYPSDKAEETPKYDYPSSFFRDEPDPFVITVSNKNKPEIITNNYNYDLISIINDYLKKLYEDIINYFNNISIILAEVEGRNYSKIMSKYNISTEKVSLNYKHLSDLIIKSQLSREMKTRLYNKMFNLDKTIIQIKTCKVGVEQRIRYYQSIYQSENTIENTISNRLLEKSRMEYDLKYKKNFTNLYKYLNSSEILFDECLCMCINEIQAKAILIKEEGLDL